jgi:signal peptidase I
VAGVALVGLCVVLVSWWAIGGRWLIVRTPSMGTYAPVGTLLWVKPANINRIHVGDVITFHPAELPSLTVTHRVAARNSDGTLQTKGNLNTAIDPGRVDQQHLVGRVAARWPGVGWLVRALPLLLLGGIGWWALTGFLASRRSRAPLRVLGASVIVAIAIYVYNPLFGAEQLSFTPLGLPGAQATYVGTGLLPVKLTAEGAPSVLVHDGQKRSIVVARPGHDGRFHVTVVPTIPWITWTIIAAGCLAPAVWSVIVGVEQPPPGRHRKRRRRLRRSAPTATAV